MPKLIEERICRPKQNLRFGSERRAIHVSESIFFIEYHLHSQLINKMKFMGKNAIFSLKIQILISEQFIIGIASGTAITLRALPLPSPIEVKVDKYFQKRELKNTKKALFDQIQKDSQLNLDINFQMPIFRIYG